MNGVRLSDPHSGLCACAENFSRHRQSKAMRRRRVAPVDGADFVESARRNAKGAERASLRRAAFNRFFSFDLFNMPPESFKPRAGAG